jgi:hypothetical protein
LPGEHELTEHVRHARRVRASGQHGITMSRHVLLNNIDHRELRIDTRRVPGLGDEVMSVPTFPGEFRDLQAYYPIVFVEGAGGALQPVALLGLQEGQNLFLGEAGWDAAYLPLAIERQPFLIGIGDAGEPMVHVDLGSPRIAQDGGEPVFKEFGGTTAYLDRVSSVLRVLYEGSQGNAGFVELLRAHGLLEPFVLDIQLKDGTHHRLGGLHTIAEERLRELDGALLQQLNRSGALEAIHMAMASLSNFRDLIERMERRRAADR